MLTDAAVRFRFNFDKHISICNLKIIQIENFKNIETKCHVKKCRGVTTTVQIVFNVNVVHARFSEE